ARGAAACRGRGRPPPALSHPDRRAPAGAGRVERGRDPLTGAEVVSNVGAVSCGHPRAAAAGVRMLAGGGNAGDAAVAAAFTSFVVEPAACGVAGYGHLALFLAEARQLVSVDHSVRAPALATPDMFEADAGGGMTYYGWPPVVERRNEWGAIAA